MLKAYDFFATLYPYDGGRVYEVMQAISNTYNNLQDYHAAIIWLHKIEEHARQSPENQSIDIGLMASFARNYLALNQLDSAKIMIDSAFYLQEKHKIYYNSGQRHFYRGEV